MMTTNYDDGGLVQERRKFNANALELRLSCTNPSMWWYGYNHADVEMMIFKLQSDGDGDDNGDNAATDDWW